MQSTLYFDIIENEIIMDIPTVYILKFASVPIALLLFLLYCFLRKKGYRKSSPIILIVLIIFGFLGWYNFGLFHGDGSFLHEWEHFHYFIGSKYFPELGYDGLYVGAIAAKKEISSYYAPPSKVRDLRTDKIVDYKTLINHQKQVAARFSPTRWASFVEDVKWTAVPNEVFRDHGYNPPPPFTFFARIFSARLSVSRTTMLWLSQIDTILLALSIFFIAYGFGLEKAAGFSILFGVGFLSIFFWTGGAFLRYDWFFAFIMTLVMLKKNKPLLAGSFFAYSVAVRIFPLIFLLGLLIWWLKWKNREHFLRYLIGFTVTMLLLLFLGSLAGRGVGAYFESFKNLRNLPIAYNGVGFRYLFIISKKNLSGELNDFHTPRLNDQIALEYQMRFDDNILVIIIATIVFLSFIIYVLTKVKRPEQAVIISLGAIFCTNTLSCYYWIIFIIIALYKTRYSTVLGIISNSLMYVWLFVCLRLIYSGRIEGLYGALVYFPASIILMAFFLLWYINIVKGVTGSNNKIMKLFKIVQR